jgi:hypothetical protein
LKFDRPIEARDGCFAYRFVSASGAGREVIVVWNPKSDATAELEVPRPRVRITNVVGEGFDQVTQPLPDNPRNWLLRVPLRAGAPAYVSPGR